MEDLYQWIKQHIDLAQYAQQVYGYQLDKSRSSKNSKVLIHPSESHRIVVSRREQNGHFCYFNPMDEQDKGTIVDFLVYREGSWDKVVDKLSNLSDTSQAVQYPVFPEEELDPDEEQVESLSHRDFLHDRGLSDRTLDHPWFAGRILTHKRLIDDKTMVNTAFPLFGLKQPMGYELKNHGFHGYSTGSKKSRACWMSMTPPADSIYDLFLFESAIDALSYHQLHPPMEDHFRQYMSFGGQISDGQITLLQTLVDRHPPQRIFLCMDRDNSGQFYALSIAGKLQSPIKLSSILAVSHRRDNLCLLEFHLSGTFAEPFRVQAFQETIRHAQRLAAPALADRLPLYIEAPYPDYQILHSGFPINNHTLSICVRTVLASRGLKDWMILVLPQGKDFNDDLMDHMNK
ncbi:toprim domain-containing protein [Pontibacter sp. G13]|uniref:toprim domain-containing protein n=1 Tax=Pontibacter sp. G13 TaxID=3074898 RepID=UPI00288BE425|nr:toprim domain-containing protein [Pontibacter sp. G13]WNJ21571.1 toprim domain-containing protein [Pontibacter sp. G13]